MEIFFFFDTLLLFIIRIMIGFIVYMNRMQSLSEALKFFSHILKLPNYSLLRIISNDNIIFFHHIHPYVEIDLQETEQIPAYTLS